MQYELLYIIGASQEAREDEIKNKIREIVEKAGAKILEPQITFKRKLAYPIKHETQGVYVAFRFELDELEKIFQIKSSLNLEGNALRFMITRADELPELKKREPKEEAAIEKNVRPYVPVSKKPVEEKPVPKTKPAEKPKKEKVEKISDEDIDKKLEEILKI